MKKTTFYNTYWKKQLHEWLIMSDSWAWELCPLFGVGTVYEMSEEVQEDLLDFDLTESKWYFNKWHYFYYLIFFDSSLDKQRIYFKTDQI